MSAASSTHARTVGRHGGTSGTGTPWSRAKPSGSAGTGGRAQQRPGGRRDGVAASSAGAAAADAGEHDSRDEDDDGGHRHPQSAASRSFPGVACTLPFLLVGKRAAARPGDGNRRIG